MKQEIRSTKFGRYGGQFVPEILMPALEELTEQYERYRDDPTFNKELDYYLRDFAGRPSPLYYARQLSREYGVKVYLKREDLVHGGAHKLNNTLGQALLTRYMGKKRIIAETGAGQHGTACAMAGAAFGIKTEIYMGAKDTQRQRMNVYRMELMGTKVIPVKSGSQTLKDAINEAMRDWATSVETTHYMMGSVVGPHPYPAMVRDFQSVIGKEVRTQIMEKEGQLPDSIVACTGGGSNAMGIFYPFIDDDVDLFAVEAGGSGMKTTEKEALHSASLCMGEEGVLHGMRTKVLQNKYGQILESSSIAAGLDYAGVGPELAYLADTGRIRPCSSMDSEALEAFHDLCRLEGIIPALESSHAVAYVKKAAESGELGDIVVINISGRGDKDLETVMGVRK
ncbi:tryptophan synthase, beta chain [Candidatus Methanoperedens nitroreducens]|uniref:Tryptophan synthase beta chain n=1 Tax=Candidatus Methanoperedens nitratireducens TaxID=1392998 RepID=A0A062V700_9EURY|nr:tryptophan synthase subunit beta [Candidatus Methanoperedens nitroreducens]KCZ71185.1 tryptophan synthase, beta chain [Candidatus Methanoperedens nitroreducens]MDJ1421437.1 tryptophan synthase subunit beta [Candidatus Methanoperedens sp.]